MATINVNATYHEPRPGILSAILAWLRGPSINPDTIDRARAQDSERRERMRRIAIARALRQTSQRVEQLVKRETGATIHVVIAPTGAVRIDGEMEHVQRAVRYLTTGANPHYTLAAGIRSQGRFVAILAHKRLSRKSK